jgi:hypothetical protein
MAANNAVNFTGLEKFTVDPVAGNAKYTIIQDAINAAQLVNGVVIVAPGTYTESLNITAPVYLTSAAPANPSSAPLADYPVIIRGSTIIDATAGNINFTCQNILFEALYSTPGVSFVAATNSILSSFDGCAFVASNGTGFLNDVGTANGHTYLTNCYFFGGGGQRAMQLDISDITFNTCYWLGIDTPSTISSGVVFILNSNINETFYISHTPTPLVIANSIWIAQVGQPAARMGTASVLQIANTVVAVSSSASGYMFDGNGVGSSGGVAYSCLVPTDYRDFDPNLTLTPIIPLPSLAGITDGNNGQTALGVSAGNAALANDNTLIGVSAGSNYTTTETENICIGANVGGTVGESTTTRIGVEGTQTACFVAGINGNTITGPDYVTIDTTTGQLGATTVAPAGISVAQQVFTSSGTYTPTTGMAYCKIEVLGGGGGGGGAALCSGNYSAGGGGGGAGGYSQGIFSSGTVGASQTVTIGAAGTAGAAGANTGGTGGTTSVGALISATGGVGGAGGSEVAYGYTAGGAGGTGTGGSCLFTGTEGGTAFTTTAGTDTPGMGGFGANSIFGGGARATGAVIGGNAGIAASNYGSGGGGGTTFSTAAAGGVGFKGIVIITEYMQ